MRGPRLLRLVQHALCQWRRLSSSPSSHATVCGVAIGINCLETQFYIGSTNAASQAIDFSSDGTLMYTTGTNGVINEYQLSTAWDVSTAFVDFFNLVVDGGIRGLYFKPDGTSIYSANVSYDHIMQIDLKEPYKLFPPATKTLNTLLTTNLTVSGIELSPDLQRLYLVGSNTRGLYKFDFNP